MVIERLSIVKSEPSDMNRKVYFEFFVFMAEEEHNVYFWCLIYIYMYVLSLMGNALYF